MIRTPSSHSLRAFTLLEVVVVLTLFTIMMFALIQFYISYNTSYIFDRALTSTASGAATIMGECATDILQADQVIASHTFGGTIYSSGAHVLVLELPAMDSSGNIITNAYDYVVVYTANGKVYRTIDANASSIRKSGTKQLSDTIQALTFTYNNTDVTLVTNVLVDVQTALSVKAKTAQTHLTEQLYLRNFPT